MNSSETDQSAAERVVDLNILPLQSFDPAAARAALARAEGRGNSYSIYLEYSVLQQHWMATSREWPGLVGTGPNRAEALRNIEGEIEWALGICSKTVTPPPVARVQENRVRGHG